MKNPFKFLRLALLCMLLLVFASIHAQSSTKGFVLKGNISGTADGTRVRLVDIDGQKILDSALTTNGAFVLKG
jgi:hypothetical protein